MNCEICERNVIKKWMKQCKECYYKEKGYKECKRCKQPKIKPNSQFFICYECYNQISMMKEYAFSKK